MNVYRFLADLDKFGICLGLERIQQILQDLDHPEQKVPVIHIAGTNGKGSVTALLSNILINAGYRVGCYTSPHLVDWRERITINGNWITIAEFEAALERVNGVILPDAMPTQFEVVTAAAWWYFAQQQVDIAVIETGLGGRLDATNVVERPLVSVITSIAMDHWQRLGNSLGAIAFEKAGIIKSGSPVIAGELHPEAKLVIEQKAKDCQSQISWVEPAQFRAKGGIWRGFDYDLGLLGNHQLANSALAIATIEVLQAQGWHIPESSIRDGLANTKWEGRLQLINYGGQKLWLDGAHNLAAAEALRGFFDQAYPGQPCAWVIGILETKDWQGMLKALLKPSDRLYAVKVPDHKSCEPEDLANLAAKILTHKPDIAKDWLDGINQALSDRKDDSQVILSGSLYLVGACLQNLGAK